MIYYFEINTENEKNRESPENLEDSKTPGVGQKVYKIGKITGTEGVFYSKKSPHQNRKEATTWQDPDNR